MENSCLRIADIRHGRIKSWNWNNMMAPFWRLYWKRSGTAKILHGQNETILENRLIYLIPAHTRYLARADEAIELFQIHFYAVWFYPHREPLSFPITRETKNHLKRITQLSKMEQDDSAKSEKLLIANTIVFSILSKIPFSEFERSSKDVHMEEAIELMLEHLKDGITSQELADEAGMSLSTFLREFSKRFKITPAKYLNLLRINLAATLLRRGEESIEEIAEETGFYDRYHLSKVFKRERGISPGAFRKLMQEL